MMQPQGIQDLNTFQNLPRYIDQIHRALVERFLVLSFFTIYRNTRSIFKYLKPAVTEMQSSNLEIKKLSNGKFFSRKKKNKNTAKRKAVLITICIITTLALALLCTERTISSSYLLCFQSATAFFSVCKHRQCRISKNGFVPESSESHRLNAITFSHSFIRMNTMCQ